MVEIQKDWTGYNNQNRNWNIVHLRKTKQKTNTCLSVFVVNVAFKQRNVCRIFINFVKNLKSAKLVA